ncbi:MAG TPA: hypothetical protein VF742_13700 [Terracidiphilus sp.]
MLGTANPDGVGGLSEFRFGLFAPELPSCLSGTCPRTLLAPCVLLFIQTHLAA